ncbi:MAG TPA: hypothetical protein P5243_10795, partial [Bacteroidales bacterium]|nr:hypothetical protein [Bacteroidales bacterium]
HPYLPKQTVIFFCYTICSHISVISTAQCSVLSGLSSSKEAIEQPTDLQIYYNSNYLLCGLMFWI